MTETYQTIITISAVPEGDMINFSVTDESDEKTPEFIGTNLTGIMLIAGITLRKSYVALIQEFPELENNFKTELILTFENTSELTIKINSTGTLGAFFTNAIQAYLLKDDDFMAFLER